MQDNVDYRLLERFRAKQSLNAQQPQPQKAAAATAASQRLPAIELRD